MICVTDWGEERFSRITSVFELTPVRLLALKVERGRRCLLIVLLDVAFLVHVLDGLYEPVKVFCVGECQPYPTGCCVSFGSDQNDTV